MTDEFKVVNRKQIATIKKNRRLNNKEAYIKWAEEVWPTILIEYLNLAMEKYERSQPKLIGETESDYDFRYEKAHQSVLKKHGTCEYSVRECMDRGHSSCEERRRQAYNVYQEDESFLQEFNEPIDFTVENKKVSKLSPVVPKKLPIEELQQNEIVDTPEVSEVSTEQVLEVVTEQPKVVIVKKAPKPKSQEDLDLEKLCNEIESLPVKKKKGKK